MGVPAYQEIMLPMLRLIESGHETIGQCYEPLRTQFKISVEQAEELLPSGKQSILSNRAHWARQYLSQAGLVAAQKRGHYKITVLGADLLASNPTQIDNAMLKKYPKFQAFLNRSAKQSDETPEVVEYSPIPENKQTPEDVMASSQSVLDAALRDDLLSILKDINPVRFERLILDLLLAMGYGGGDLANSRMTKSSGDGGIDGIIHEDALGLDAVYIQAKRYAPDIRVGRPAIQQFVGSLNGEGATKGMFVTTSDFSTEARAFLGKVQHRIVLINGQELARLMIRHGVGVRDRTSYVVRTVDEDYFSDLNGG